MKVCRSVIANSTRAGHAVDCGAVNHILRDKDRHIAGLAGGAPDECLHLAGVGQRGQEGRLTKRLQRCRRIERGLAAVMRGAFENSMRSRDQSAERNGLAQPESTRLVEARLA